MFHKVLVVDDIDLNNIATEHVLRELEIPEVCYVKYCDEAYLKLRKAYLDGDPFQLVITDLSFKADHREEKIASGEALIQKIKENFPAVKIIAFSIEDRAYRIKKLLYDFGIEGYVWKHRHSNPELKSAVQTVYAGEEKYITPVLKSVVQDKSTREIDSYDIQLLWHLSQGVAQETMEHTFKERGITPNSKSTIEKRINKLKIYFKANNTIHLVAIAKDLGLV